MRMTIISISPTSRSKLRRGGSERQVVAEFVLHGHGLLSFFCFGKPTNKSLCCVGREISKTIPTGLFLLVDRQEYSGSCSAALLYKRRYRKSQLL